jgi:hypothetical protein
MALLRRLGPNPPADPLMSARTADRLLSPPVALVLISWSPLKNSHLSLQSGAAAHWPTLVAQAGEALTPGHRGFYPSKQATRPGRDPASMYSMLNAREQRIMDWRLAVRWHLDSVSVHGVHLVAQTPFHPLFLRPRCGALQDDKLVACGGPDVWACTVARFYLERGPAQTEIYGRSGSKSFPNSDRPEQPPHHIHGGRGRARVQAGGGPPGRGTLASSRNVDARRGRSPSSTCPRD